MKIGHSSKYPFSMKKYLLLLFLAINFSLYGTTYYVSPYGSDYNNGDLNNPFATLNKAWTVIRPGDVVYLRGGTYYFTNQQVLKGVNGTAGNLISVWAYPGEKPVLTRSSSFSWSYPCGIYFEGDYFHFKGIEITGYYQVNSYVWSGLRSEDSNYNIFEQLNIHHNGHGFRLQGNSNGNRILNCDFHHNQDPLSSDSYGDADGLEITYLPYGVSNTVSGCRFWWNTDDGIDLISNAGYVLIENCWSWYNGYIPDTFNQAGNGNGFKLGGATSDFRSTVLRTVRNCLSFRNRGHGFDQNQGSFIMQLYNNTSYDNVGAGFCLNMVSGIAHVLRNNIAYGNDAYQTNADYGWIHDHNTWNGIVSVSDNDFLSLTPSGLNYDRDSNGNLPVINFIHLASGSDMIDAGVSVGLAYSGSAPDLGCFENGIQTTVPTPSYLSSVIYNSNPSVIDITFDLSLAGIVPPSSAFSVSVNSATRSISNIYVSDTKVWLELSSAVSAGDAVTVSYTKPSSNPLQTISGGQVASFSGKSVTNNVSASKPVYLSSVIQNSSPAWLEMTFNTDLANVLPSVAAFTVRVNSVTRSISYVVVSQNKVCLALGSPVASGDNISVSYTKPSSNPIQSTSGGQADSFSAQTVTNNVAASIPVYVSSAVENNAPSSIEIIYSLSLANIVPPSSAFNVQVNSTSRSINSVTVSGTKVILTLASPVTYGDRITVAYTKPSSNPVQTVSGGQAATMGAQSVTNKVGAPAPVFTGSSVENASPSRIVLTYNSTLANIVPPASAFKVNVSSTSRTVSSVSISGTNVILNLASQVSYGDVITVSYTKPSSNPIQTPEGGQAASLSTQTVKNNLLPPVPVFVSSSIENSTPTKVDIIYSLALANVVPSVSAFTVTVNSNSRSITSVVVSGTKVTLTLSSAVSFGDAVTVEYTKPSASPLQSASGAQAASSGVKSVLNKVGAPSPVLSAATVENASPAKLELTFNLSLANIIPSASTFSVKINNTVRAVSNIAISGSKVVLTLTTPVSYGDAVTVAYTKPAANPLQGTAGGQVTTFAAAKVTNKVLPPQPVYVGSVIENTSPSRIDITYNLTLANIIPSASAFEIKVNSIAVIVNNVTISGAKVFLTLAAPVKNGDVVTLAYTKPSANPLQTTAGGEAASVSVQPVSNRVGDTNTPPVIVVDYKSNSYSGFVSELDASGSYDINKDNLTYTWTIPSNIPVSTTKGARIQYLSPVVYENMNVVFTLTVSDGKTTKTSSIPVEILPYQPELEVAEVINVDASSYQAPNYPYNILDGNIATMWSVNGDNQWIVLELKEMFNVQHVKLAFHSGQKKESYFDILGSNDNENWEPVLTKSNSCAFSGDVQVFDFPPSKTGKEFRYIKLVGHCNSSDTWNYISEFKIFGYRHRNPSSYENQIVKIFPNPASEYINVKIEETNLSPDFIRIISMSGKILHEERLDPGINEFTMPIDLMKGIYIIQMGEGKITLFSQKLIVNQ